jgi:predicted DsbA family dithiol-disulfide isomerase
MGVPIRGHRWSIRTEHIRSSDVELPLRVFRDCRDISRWDTQCEIAETLGADVRAIEECIHGGAAFARLAGDYEDADKMRIEGSPSFVLNEGRQKLYGNVGFHLMEANIQELLRAPRTDEASWC